MLRAHGLGDAEYGSLFVPQLGLAALGALGAGFLLARVGARRALAAGFAFMGLSQVALAMVTVAEPSQVYPLSLLGTALLGLGAGLSAGPLNAYPQVLFPARSESAVVALHTVVGLGLSASPLLSGLALSRGIWTAYPLLLLGLGGLFTAAVLRENLPEPEPRSGGARPSRPVGSARLWIFLCVAFLYGSTEALFGNWSVPFLTEERALGPAEATLALASFWAALSVGRVAVALLVTRVRPAAVLPLLALLMGAGSWLVPTARGDSGAILVLSIGGLGCSAVFPLALGLACGRFPDHRAWVSGSMFAALCSGLAIGSLAAGLAHESLDLASIYRLGAVAPALAAVLAGVAGRGDAGDAARPLPPGVPPGV